jgi:hypothetical protein
MPWNHDRPGVAGRGSLSPLSRTELQKLALADYPRLNLMSRALALTIRSSSSKTSN